MELFGDLGMMIARWVHFLAGVAWIGLLYYFNFVQGPFFAEIEANVKNVAVTKLLPRALWWFRMGALFTWLSGVYMLMGTGHVGGFEVYSTSWGLSILVGALLGTFIFFNVWLIIWPNQKVVIASATQVLAGGKPLDNAAACGARALLASRTNTMFSIPMLMFMGAAKHMPYEVNASNFSMLWVIILIVVGILEINAIKGKLGPMTTVRGVITSGFVLSVVLTCVIKFLG